MSARLTECCKMPEGWCFCAEDARWTCSPSRLPVLLVCGGRDFEPAEVHRMAWAYLLANLQPRAVLHGDARGADRWAASVATSAGWSVFAFPAEWDRWGRSAGFRRNAEMVDRAVEHRPALVVAFPGSRGTRDTIARALAAGLGVIDLGEL